MDKSGVPARSERVATDNQLLRIAEAVGDRTWFAGRAASCAEGMLRS